MKLEFQTKMTGSFSAADWLNDVNNKGYGSLPIPVPRDAQISELLRTWRRLDNSARLAAAEEIPPAQRFTLLAYSERMASLAVRQRNREWIILGLLALGVDGWHGDWRDNATIISLHYDASLRLKADPAELFETAAALLPANAATALRSFLKRSDHDKTPKVMGYVAEADADGFRYRRMW